MNMVTGCRTRSPGDEGQPDAKASSDLARALAPGFRAKYACRDMSDVAVYHDA